MAWIRTALSMLSFGFTIYKVLDRVNGPMNVRLFLVAPGGLDEPHVHD